MWLFRRLPQRELERRIEELADELKHLTRRFDKVQGELTTTLRHVRTAQVVPEANGDLLGRLAALEAWAESQGD